MKQNAEFHAENQAQNVPSRNRATRPTSQTRLGRPASALTLRSSGARTRGSSANRLDKFREETTMMLPKNIITQRPKSAAALGRYGKSSGYFGGRDSTTKYNRDSTTRVNIRSPLRNAASTSRFQNEPLLQYQAGSPRQRPNSAVN